MEVFCNNNNVKFLQNAHINKSHLFHDIKHLNGRGFKFFAKNLKHAIYETTKTRNRQQRQPHPNPHWQNNSRRGTSAPFSGPQHFNWNNNQGDKRSYAAAISTPARTNQQALNQSGQSLQQSNHQIDQSQNLTGLPHPLRMLIHQLQSYI